MAAPSRSRNPNDRYCNSPQLINPTHILSSRRRRHGGSGPISRLSTRNTSNTTTIRSRPQPTYYRSAQISSPNILFTPRHQITVCKLSFFVISRGASQAVKRTLRRRELRSKRPPQYSVTSNSLCPITIEEPIRFPCSSAAI